MASLSVQLWSLRNETASNPEEVLRNLPGLGFGGVELAGTYDWPATRWQDILRETQLSVTGAHVGLADLEKDTDAHFAFHRALRNKRLIVPWLPPELHNVKGFTETAARLNRLGAIAKSENLELGYHNHDFEFRAIEGNKRGIDILLAETDPNLVRFEFDVFWVEKGGENAPAFLEQHAARTFLIHAKELRRSDGKEVAIGEGNIDFPAIVRLAQTNNWPIVVEYEQANAPSALQHGSAYLRKLLAS